jgi:hypothetical protein
LAEQPFRTWVKLVDERYGFGPTPLGEVTSRVKNWWIPFFHDLLTYLLTYLLQPHPLFLDLSVGRVVLQTAKKRCYSVPTSRSTKRHASFFRRFCSADDHQPKVIQICKGAVVLCSLFFVRLALSL